MIRNEYKTLTDGGHSAPPGYYYHRICPIFDGDLIAAPGFGFHEEYNTLDVIDPIQLKKWPGYSPDLTLERLSFMNDMSMSDLLRNAIRTIQLTNMVSIYPDPLKHEVLVFTSSEAVRNYDFGIVVPKRVVTELDTNARSKINRIGIEYV